MSVRCAIALVMAVGAGCGGSAPATGGPGGIGGAGASDVADLLQGSRWWIRAPGAGRLVIHWTGTDHSLWTQTGRFPLRAERNRDGSSTLSLTGGDTCYVARATNDPDAIELWSCNAPRPRDVSLGLLRRGAPLIREIRYDEALTTDAAGEETAVLGIDPTERWVVTGVGEHLSLWKSDTGQTYEMGAGRFVRGPVTRSPFGPIAFSSDGRYVAYARATSDNGGSALVLFDTTTGVAQVMEPRLDQRALVARFSPDNRRIVFHGNLRDDGLYSDLVSVELATGARTMLAANKPPHSLYDCLWFTATDHVVFCVDDTQLAGDNPIRSHEFSTGTQRDLGNIRQAMVGPDGSYLAISTLAGDIQLFEDADWTPRLLGRNIIPNDSGQGVADVGFTPSPDGRLLAFVEHDGTFHVYDTRDRMDHAVKDTGGCYASTGPVPDGGIGGVAAAAFFLDDGQTLVHPISGGCGAGSTASGIARYDVTTHQEQVVMFDDWYGLMAFSRHGDVAYGALGRGAWLMSWQAPATKVPLAGGIQNYTFSRDDRTLVGVGSDSISFRDLGSGMTAVQVAFTNNLWVVTNPQNGVTLNDTTTGLTLYPPAGEARMLTNDRANAQWNPSGSGAIFNTFAGGPQLIRLEADATARQIGDGALLGITDRYVFLRELDGICALAL